MNGIFPKAVYRTPNPESQISEAYEIHIEALPGAPDPHRCWIVREVHGHYDKATKTFHHKVETLGPAGTQHFPTIEEAIHQANQRVLLRAREGFHFLFTLDYRKQSPAWYEAFEVVLPADQMKPLPWNFRS